MTFGFEDRYAMFDVTPVENQFILECLPAAKGDFVKVYLYGLMRCYHPEENTDLETMSREIGLSQEEIQRAYRYWERRGAVRRISDQPPAWQYLNLKRNTLTGGEPPDPEYEQFCENIYAVFENGRRLHGSELQTCYEWVEDLKLPAEVVIMLLKHMSVVKGKNFTIQSASQVALQMAEEQIQTIEDAEDFLTRDKEIYEGVRTVLRKLGKRGYPSEAQLDMYRKWRREWKFTPGAIEAACAETAKGDPSMGYLDGILNRMRQEAGGEREINTARIRESVETGRQAREVIGILGSGRLTAENKLLLQELETDFDHETILIAARECAQTGKQLGELKPLLDAWKQKHLDTPEKVSRYVENFHRQNGLLKQLREVWNADVPKVGEAGRRYIAKWTEELGFSREMILHSARYAYEAKSPMAYLDKLLVRFAEAGVRTPEEAERVHAQFRESARKSTPERKVSAQQYEQRDYTGKQDRLLQEFLEMNGGMNDA